MELKHRRPKVKILGFFSFHFYKNVQCNVTHQGNVTYPWMVLHNNELDYAKRDSPLETHGGVVLQRFELNL